MLRRHCQLSTAATINTKDRSVRTSLDPAGRGVPKTSVNFVVGATQLCGWRRF
jgi:hypothetical protein